MSMQRKDGEGHDIPSTHILQQQHSGCDGYPRNEPSTASMPSLAPDPPTIDLRVENGSATRTNESEVVVDEEAEAVEKEASETPSIANNLDKTAKAAIPVKKLEIPPCIRATMSDWYDAFEESRPSLMESNTPEIEDSASQADSGVLVVDPDETYLSAKARAIKEVNPPVTKETLKELELRSIQNNLALRIDLCFDHELFFQRISGLKGEEKVQKTRLYFALLSVELQMYSHRGTKCNKCRLATLAGQQPTIELPLRLEACLSALRDLVDMLVPENEKKDVKQRFVPDWIARGIRTRQFDAPSFSQWLSSLLMSHCAPIRDELCRGMSQKISTGMISGRVDTVIDGLKDLFELLESMKLDIANHQVRSFKYLLIADTVPFLKDCFRKMIASKQMNVEKSKRWFDRLENKRFESEHGGFSKLLCGVLNLCSSHEPLPRSFTYDQERISALRNDILDLWQLHVCMQSFCTTFHRKLNRYPRSAELSQFRSRCLEYIHSDLGVNEGIEEHLEEIAVEISHVISDTMDGIEGLTISFSRLRIDSEEVFTDLTTRLSDNRDSTLAEIMPKIAEKSRKHAVRFLRLDTLQVSNDQRIWTTQRAAKGYPQAPEIEDISRRLAHVVVIHWQVWSDLVYLKDNDQ